MPNDSFTLYILSGILAFIPALIWLTVIFKKTKRKGIQTLIFLGSIFSVVPVFILHYLLREYPQFDVLRLLSSNIRDATIISIFTYISVGIVEEIVKQLLIRGVDHKYLLIQTINESLQFSLISALGFSFAENIFYIYSIYINYGIKQLFIAYLFRSIFTTCAHLVFSGFLGYYYGIAKFSLNIVEQNKWLGKKQRLTNFISRVFGMSKTQSYKELTILKGLGIAIVLHATYDFLLELNQTLLVVIFIIISAAVLLHLLKQRSGKLILITDIDTQKTSSMAQKDEQVVIELLGMWFQDKKYVDVIHICQRLLQRDPDNKVVQLFKAKAGDKIQDESAYGKILKNIFPKKDQKKLDDLAKEKPETLPIVPIQATQAKATVATTQKTLTPTENKPAEPTAPTPEEQVFKLKI